MATDLQAQLITAFQQSWPNLASAIRGHQFPDDSNPVPLLSSIASTTDTPEKEMFCSLLVGLECRVAVKCRDLGNSYLVCWNLIAIGHDLRSHKVSR